MSIFDGEIYALMRDKTSIRKLSRTSTAWSPLTSFAAPVIEYSFVAFGPDRLAAVEKRGSEITTRIWAHTSEQGVARNHRLELQEGTNFSVAKPAVLDGEPYFAFTENLSGVYLITGNGREGFRIVSQRGSQLLFALTSFAGTVLATGGFGPIVQFDPRPNRGPCEDSVLLGSSVLEVFVHLGEERFLMAGETRHDLLNVFPRDEPQRVIIARALPR